MRTTKLFFLTHNGGRRRRYRFGRGYNYNAILKTNFSRKVRHCQERSTPTLQSLSQAGKGFVRHFQSSNYERYQWLTGSEKHCKLYCWECLLFASDRFGVWSHTGFANLSCLTKAATRHQSTAGHLQAMVLLKTFGDTRVDLQLNKQARRATKLHNEKVLYSSPAIL